MPMISILQKARRARLWLNINLRCYRTEKMTLTTRSKQVPLHPLMNIKCVKAYKSILVYLIWFHSQPMFSIRWLQEEIWFICCLCSSQDYSKGKHDFICCLCSSQDYSKRKYDFICSLCSSQDDSKREYDQFKLTLVQ
jgi:hypothetical protein